MNGRKSNGQVSICHVFFGNVFALPILRNELIHYRKHNIHATVIAPRYPHEQSPEVLAISLESNFDHVGFHFISLTGRKLTASQQAGLKLIRYIEFVVRTLARILKTRADVYVGHDMPAMLPVFLGCWLAGRKMIYHAHEIWSEAGTEISPLLRCWKPLEMLVARRADLVVVPEENRAEIFYREFGARKRPVIVRNIPDWKPLTNRLDLRKKIGIEENTVLVLYHGLLSPSRCLPELVDSLSWLPEDVHVVLLGPGERAFVSSLEEKGRKAGMGSRLHVLHRVSYNDVQEYISSADIGIVLYRNRGRNNYFAAPNKFYEYAFSGVPVVVSDFPGLRKLVQDGEFGTWCDPESPKDIARAVMKVKETVNRSALAGRAREMFSWEKEFQCLANAYRTLIGNPGGKGD